MTTKRCPNCGLVNPASAERCDCGRSFVDGTFGAPLPARIEDERNRRMMRAVAFKGLFPTAGACVVGGLYELSRQLSHWDFGMLLLMSAGLCVATGVVFLWKARR